MFNIPILLSDKIECTPPLNERTVLINDTSSYVADLTLQIILHGIANMNLQHNE